MGVWRGTFTAQLPMALPQNVSGPNERWAQVWCGLFPYAYNANRPSVVQFVIFTVYVTTGDTVTFAYQGLYGAFLATANVALMGILLKGRGGGFVDGLEPCDIKLPDKLIFYYTVTEDCTLETATVTRFSTVSLG